MTATSATATATPRRRRISSHAPLARRSQASEGGDQPETADDQCDHGQHRAVAIATATAVLGPGGLGGDRGVIGGGNQGDRRGGELTFLTTRWGRLDPADHLTAVIGLQIIANPCSEPLVREVCREALLAGAHPLVRFTLEDSAALLASYGSDEQLEYVSPMDDLEAETVSGRLFVQGTASTHSPTNADPVKVATRERAQARLPGPTAWLVTKRSAEAAVALYRSSGWEEFTAITPAGAELVVFATPTPARSAR